MHVYNHNPDQSLPTAIVVEDQPVIWEYAKSCLEGLCDIKAFCSTTAEAEEAFREHKPDLVWLDCYLGEISEYNQGLKNSGILLAKWIKSHSPQTKVFIFTSANEVNILQIAKSIDIEGIGLGGKFIKDKEVVIDGIKDVLAGGEWVSPNLVEEFKLDELGKITLFEFCVICSLIVGKPTSQIADELDTTRKRVNNSVYRVKEKLKIDVDIEREELLDVLKDKIKDQFNPNEHYNISDIITINTIVQDFLNPMLKQVKTGDFDRVNLEMINENIENASSSN